MVKCVVSRCPNRVGAADANRPPKRFFRFPREPERVKVWLAALRETDQQDSSEQHFICEDHFLPEDVTTDGVNGDAIPIMPPCLDVPLGTMSAWGAESSEEEEEEEEDEEEQWAGGDEEDDAYEGGAEVLADAEPPGLEPEPPAAAAGPPQLGPETKRTMKTPDASPNLKKTKKRGGPMSGLLQGFLKLLMAAPDGSLDKRHAVEVLQTRRQRITEITNVLQDISLLERRSRCTYKWIGPCPVSSFLTENRPRLRELDDLRVVEDSLDAVISSCSQQLFDVTDDAENAALAYVTFEDVSRLRNLQEQTVFLVKAPDETRLVVPAPTEDNIRVHLKGGQGPILVLTCDVEEQSGSFTALQESRIRTGTLRTESSSPQTAVQSA